MITEKIRKCFKLYREKDKLRKWKRDFLNYHKNTTDPEIYVMVEQIRKTGKFNMMNRPLSMDYGKLQPEIVFDGEKGLSYINDESGKVYLPEGTEKAEGIALYQALKQEQDRLSPHCYMNHADWDFLSACAARGGGGVILFELGAMEGMFSLKLIDYVRHAYIFECEDRWAKALEATFSPYCGKTDIIKKYVSDCTTQESVRLDDLFREYAEKDGWGDKERVTIVVKMDIEGAEMKALEGMREMLGEYPEALLFICAYHNQQDEERIRLFFQNGYEIGHTPGYFCFYADPSYGRPYIRRCVMKIKKKRRQKS